MENFKWNRKNHFHIIFQTVLFHHFVLYMQIAYREIRGEFFLVCSFSGRRGIQKA